MALTWRTPALLLLSVAVVLVRPEASTVWAVVGVVLLLVVLDTVAAPRVANLRISRTSPGPTRLGEPAETVLTVLNGGRRRVTGLLRDAWQPSAGATSAQVSCVRRAEDTSTKSGRGPVAAM